MAKLKSDAIQQDDLSEFVEKNSDFAFEQKILKQLRGLGFDAQHGGTYIDPVTQVPREFDIRASKPFTTPDDETVQYRIAAAVECKNINENYPLLVECVPINDRESFHYVVETRKSPEWCTHRINGSHLYPQGLPVGKSCCQVGRSPQSGDISASDSGVYGKWSQALASLVDLFVDTQRLTAHRSRPNTYSFLAPILVVPDDRLWIVEFDGEGQKLSDPKKVDNVPYWVNKQISKDPVPSERRTQSYFASHIEFCTQSGLATLFAKITYDPENRVFAIPD